MKLDDGNIAFDFSELTTGELLSIVFSQPYATTNARQAALVEYTKRLIEKEKRERE